MRLAGALAAVAYRLSRHRFLQLPLDGAIALAGLLLLAYGALRVALGAAWPVAPWLIAGLIGWGGVALVLRLRAWTVFVPGGSAAAGPALPAFAKVPLRASGLFEVGGKRRHLVQAAGTIEATEFGERIVVVRISPVSLLGLFASPEEEWGCWYLYFRPQEIVAALPGLLYHGGRERPALRLTFHRPELATTYLSFDDGHSRDLVAADLSS